MTRALIVAVLGMILNVHNFAVLTWAVLIEYILAYLLVLELDNLIAASHDVITFVL